MDITSKQSSPNRSTQTQSQPANRPCSAVERVHGLSLVVQLPPYLAILTSRGTERKALRPERPHKWKNHRRNVGVARNTENTELNFFRIATGQSSRIRENRATAKQKRFSAEKTLRKPCSTLKEASNRSCSAVERVHGVLLSDKRRLKQRRGLPH